MDDLTKLLTVAHAHEYRTNDTKVVGSAAAAPTGSLTRSRPVRAPHSRKNDGRPTAADYRRRTSRIATPLVVRPTTQPAPCRSRGTKKTCFNIGGQFRIAASVRAPQEASC